MIKGIQYVYAIISCVLLTQLICTWSAWVPYDFNYPKVGLFLNDAFLNGTAHYIATISLVLSLIILVVPRLSLQRKVLPIVLLLVLLLIADDVNRFQPWLYTNLLLLITMYFNTTQAYLLMRLSLVAIYFWSGVHKLNQNFAWEVFPYFMKAFHLNELFYLPADEIGTYQLPMINHLAWIVPLTEIAVGIGLLFTRTVKLALIVAIVLHLLTIYILGPIGLNWNSVVWIWNVEFIILLLLLFSEKSRRLHHLSWRGAFQRVSAKAYLLIVAVFPVLWYVSLWPHNLSYHLYSGYNPTIRFYFEGVNTKILESDYAEFTFYDVDQQQSYILLDYYLMNKINLPVFAEEMYFKKTGKGVCNCFGYESVDAGIRIQHRSKFSAKIIEKEFSCKELLQE